MIFNTQQNDGQFEINDFQQDEVKQEEKKISSMNSNLRNDDSALHNGLAKMIDEQKVSDLPEYLHSSDKVQVEPTMPVEKYVSIFEAWIQYVKQVEGNQLRIDERQAYLYVKQNGLEILLESLQIYMKKGKIQYLGKLESKIQRWSIRNQQNLIDFQDSLFSNESNCEDILNYIVKEFGNNIPKDMNFPFISILKFCLGSFMMRLISRNIKDQYFKNRMMLIKSKIFLIKLNFNRIINNIKGIEKIIFSILI